MRAFRWLVIVLSVCVLAASLLSYISMYVSPAKAWYLTFFGLAYLPVTALHIALLLWWLFRHRTWFVVMLVALLPGFEAHQSSVAFGENTLEKTDSSQVFSIATFNVKGFDFTSEQPQRESLVQAIIATQADLICLQEFNSFHAQPGKPDNLQEIKDGSELPYQHYVKCYENRKGSRSFGLVILSRYRIVQAGHLAYPTGSKMNTTIWADVVLPHDTLRIYSTHLQSNQLTHSDFEFIGQTQEGDTLSFDGKRVASKLKSSAFIRAGQVEDLQQHLQSSPHPVVLCGDFNDTPVSFTYHTLSSSLQDAFLTCGRWTGATYIPFPFIRIDYILYQPQAGKAVQYQKIKVPGSDHYMVQAWFSGSLLSSP